MFQSCQSVWKPVLSNSARLSTHQLRCTLGKLGDITNSNSVTSSLHSQHWMLKGGSGLKDYSRNSQHTVQKKSLRHNWLSSPTNKMGSWTYVPEFVCNLKIISRAKQNKKGLRLYISSISPRFSEILCYEVN